MFICTNAKNMKCLCESAFILLHKTKFVECNEMHSVSFTQPSTPGQSGRWFVWWLVCTKKKPEVIFGTNPSSLFSVFFLLTLSGYHVSSAIVEEGARWESRHLLQEVYENGSQLYSEPEKNCTEPGKTGCDASFVSFCIASLAPVLILA